MTTFERIEEILKSQFGQNVKISPDHNLVRDLGADSLHIIEIIIQLEEAFGIIILDPVPNLDTIADIVEFVDSII